MKPLLSELSEMVSEMGTWPPGTAKRPAGVPLSESVASVVATCPVHGPVAHRRHKTGLRRNGEQRYRLRCLPCHADDQRAPRE